MDDDDSARLGRKIYGFNRYLVEEQRSTLALRRDWMRTYMAATWPSRDVAFAPVRSLHIRTRAHAATASAAVHRNGDVYGVSGSTVENSDSNSGDFISMSIAQKYLYD